jgi:hypothetical protein
MMMLLSHTRKDATYTYVARAVQWNGASRLDDRPYVLPSHYSRLSQLLVGASAAFDMRRMSW